MSNSTMSPQSVMVQSMTLSSIPAATMLIGGLFPLISSKPPSKMLAFALQHFAAGMLLAAIAQELVPPLSAADHVHDIMAILIGFSLGVVLMIGLEFLVSDEESVEGTEMKENMITDTELVDHGHTHGAHGHFHGGESSSNSGSERSEISSTAGSTKRSKSFTSYRIHEKNSRGSSKIIIPSFPIAFAAAVYIDSAMDGLLIGLALVTGKNAGVFMAVALCVEMGFLGLTFSTAIMSQPASRSVPAALIGPAVMVAGACLGGLIANALAANNAAMVGCTAFGVAALLYMVCEELLVSAHESGEEHVWWVDLQVYIGFMFSLIAEKLLTTNLI